MHIQGKFISPYTLYIYGWLSLWMGSPQILSKTAQSCSELLKFKDFNNISVLGKNNTRHRKHLVCDPFVAGAKPGAIQDVPFDAH